jgi:carnitine 3-dehydrogenase
MHPTPDSPIKHVTVVGTGLIGASWTALFLAHGLRVSATDPAPHAEENLRRAIDEIWPTLTALGLKPGASPSNLTFSPDLETAVKGADFVQEAAPEREDFKVELFARLDAALPPSALLASSTSSLTMTTLQRKCRHPGRCLIGHPFNPPHLIPLVEIVGGKATAPEALERAEQFYASIGKTTIRLNKEVPGHVANRLQAALWREAAHLVDTGVASVADVDKAVSDAVGLRWSLMGPTLTFHLGGGPGGLDHFMQHLAGPFSKLFQDLGSPTLTPDIQRKLIEGVKASTGGQPIDSLAKQRDAKLVRILELKRQATAQRRG